MRAGALLAILPDLDVVGFRFGVAYGDLWGHRGMSHSLAMALVTGAVVTLSCFRRGTERHSRWAVGAFLVLAMASHGLLDGFTDGGLGIGYFSPWDPGRYFLPWRPIAVAPIGLAGLLEPGILPVIRSELLWVFGPLTVLWILVAALRRRGLRPAVERV